MNEILDKQLHFMPMISNTKIIIPWILSKEDGTFYFVKMDGTNRYGEPGKAAREVDSI